MQKTDHLQHTLQIHECSYSGFALSNVNDHVRNTY